MALTLPRLGLRREASILLPAAVLVLIAMSTFTLFSYRSAVDRLVDERREQAARLAAQVATQLGGSLPSEATLSRLLLYADALSVLDRDGVPLVEVGPLSGPPPFPVAQVTEPLGIGPDEVTGAIVGLSPAGSTTGEPRFVRVDLRATTLLGQTRSLPLLVTFVLGINAGLLILVVLYLRHLLRPIDALLDRARTLRGEAREGEDDVQLLLDTFERAVDALRERMSPFEDDVAALQRTLATGLESGLLVLDGEGTLLSVNPAGCALLELDPERVAGSALRDVMDDGDELRQTLEDAIARGEGVQRKECHLRRGGQDVTLGLTLHPLRRDDGAIRGWLGLFADLTEIHRRSEEERLSESLEQIGALTAGLAHELRNGLASLRGYLTLIERGAERPLDRDELLEDLSEIRHEADHLQRVVEDFLSFARPGSVRIEEVDLERLIHRAASDPVLARSKVTVRRESTFPPLQGDPQLLERALRNLLHNAARAQGEGSRPHDPIRVRLLRTAAGVEVRIEDDGPGVPDKLRDRLFHPFASGSTQGVGLGLALSRRIAELARRHRPPRGPGHRRSVRDTHAPVWTDLLPKVTAECHSSPLSPSWNPIEAAEKPRIPCLLATAGRKPSCGTGLAHQDPHEGAPARFPASRCARRALRRLHSGRGAHRHRHRRHPGAGRSAQSPPPDRAREGDLDSARGPPSWCSCRGRRRFAGASTWWSWPTRRTTASCRSPTSTTTPACSSSPTRRRSTAPPTTR